MPQVRGTDTKRAINRYKEGVAASGERWKDGVKNPRRDPIASAIAAKGAWAAGVQEAVSKDRFAKALAKVDPQSIDRAVDALGGAVFTQGVAAREATITPKLDVAIKDSIDVGAAVRAKPANTLEERIARSAEYQRQRAAKAAGR